LLPPVADQSLEEDSGADTVTIGPISDVDHPIDSLSADLDFLGGDNGLLQNLSAEIFGADSLQAIRCRFSTSPLPMRPVFSHCG